MLSAGGTGEADPPPIQFLEVVAALISTLAVIALLCFCAMRLCILCASLLVSRPEAPFEKLGDVEVAKPSVAPRSSGNASLVRRIALAAKSKPNLSATAAKAKSAKASHPAIALAVASSPTSADEEMAARKAATEAARAARAAAAAKAEARAKARAEALARAAAEEAKRLKAESEMRAQQLENLQQLHVISEKMLRVSRKEAARRTVSYREKIRQTQRQDEEMLDQRAVHMASVGRHLKGKTPHAISSLAIPPEANAALYGDLLFSKQMDELIAHEGGTTRKTAAVLPAPNALPPPNGLLERSPPITVSAKVKPPRWMTSNLARSVARGQTAAAAAALPSRPRAAAMTRPTSTPPPCAGNLYLFSTIASRLAQPAMYSDEGGGCIRAQPSHTDSHRAPGTAPPAMAGMGRERAASTESPGGTGPAG